MNAEQERLQRVYREFTDGQLVEIAEDRSDLTDDGQEALDAELGRRGLAAGLSGQAVGSDQELESGFGPGIPGVFPGGAATVEQALESGGEIEAGRANLISFFDGHELTKACEALEAAGIVPEIRPVGIEGDARTGAPQHFNVWVEASEVARAQALLREKLGLFPLPEVDALGANIVDDGLLTPLATVETPGEAQEIVQILESGAITSRVLGPDEETGMYTVEVKVAELDRALALVAARLGLE